MECLNPFTCNVCAVGFKVVGGLCSDSGCTGSITNCFACQTTDQTKCDRCEPGFILDDSFSCVSAMCADTFIFSDGAVPCVCPLGTYEQADSCVPCSDPNCNTCTVSTCQTCINTYYPIGSTCEKCLPNCESCFTDFSCDLCAQGYSISADGSCFSFGGGQNSLVDPTGTFFRCPAGCRVCTTGSSAANRVICLIPSEGFSLVGGRIVKCDPNCQSCNGYLPNLCTACFPMFTLVSGGICSPCGDRHAITCSPYNVNYTSTCNQGFSAAYFNSTSGDCNRCAKFCSRCDASGPG